MPKEIGPDHELFQQYEQMKEELLNIELEKPYTKRAVSGDASETGLIKFVQPLLMKGDSGCYQEGNGLDDFR
jgi:hypothetical protein